MDSPLQTLLFTVAGPTDGEVGQLVVSWTSAGGERALSLSDDGAHPADVPWDGVWTGGVSGTPTRELNARLLVTDIDGAEHVAFQGLLPVLDDRSAQLAWRLTDTQGVWRANPVIAAWPGDSAVIPESLSLYVGAAWTGLCLVVVAALVHVTRREGIGW